MGENHKVSVVRCENYNRNEIERAWQEAIHLLGDLANYVTPGSRVLVKPNLLSGVAPNKCVTTHPEIVRVVVKELIKQGCQVLIGDSPGTGVINKPINIKRIYDKSGISQVALELGAELYTDIVEETGIFPQGKLRQRYPLVKAALEVDHIVVISKAKTHSFMYLSGAIKNLFGLIYGLQKSVFHSIYKDQHGFASMLVELNLLLRPSLQVMDAVMAMEGDGPMAGNPRKIGAILCSKDAIGIDIILSRLMGMNPSKVPVIESGIKAGWIDPQFEKLEVVGEELKKMVVEDFIKPATYTGDHPRRYWRRFTNYLLQFFGGVYSIHPFIKSDRCIKCGKCIRSCPVQAIFMKNGIPRINRKACIHCFCCHEMCLSNSILLKRKLLGRALSKFIK